MALFESYERREKQILAKLAEYGINSIEEAAEVTIWGKITAVRGKSTWFIWRMSRHLISVLTVLHRNRIWCHMRCRKSLSCRDWM